jgi:hypothetical protein
MRPAGLESLPLGYTRLEFLESTGTQDIELPFAPLNEKNKVHDVGVRCETQVVETTNWRRPLGCVASNGQIGITPYSNSGTSRICFMHGVQKIDVTSAALRNLRAKSSINWLNSGTYHVETEQRTFEGELEKKQSTLTWWANFHLFSSATSAGDHYSASRIWSAAISHYEKALFDLIPALDSTGTPCMFDTVSRKPFYNASSGQFIAGLTMGQARNLAYLPTPTTINTLTISLPKEATLVQHNQEVNAAIAAAEAKGWNIDVQYRDKFEDESILNKYAECKTVADVIAVNADYKNDLTDEGEWIYSLENLEAPDFLFYESQTLQTAKLYLPKAKTLSRVLANTKNMTYAELKLGGQAVTRCHDPISRNPKIQKIKVWNVGKWEGSSCFHASPNLEEFEFEAQNLPEMQFWFVNDTKLKRVKINDVSKVTSAVQLYENCIALEEFPTTYPSLSNGQSMFNGCRLKKQHAVEVLSGIPRWTSGTHKLTIGIHIDHQNDEEVLAAIALADKAQTPVADGGKGWTLTVQWNGTPTAQTASTFALRKPPIYAKIDTMEYPDGTVEEYLDWGHYVSNWDEHGYQEFASLEEAYEHFNLEMPAAEESDAS